MRRGSWWYLWLIVGAVTLSGCADLYRCRLTSLVIGDTTRPVLSHVLLVPGEAVQFHAAYTGCHEYYADGRWSVDDSTVVSLRTRASTWGSPQHPHDKDDALVRALQPGKTRLVYQVEATADSPALMRQVDIDVKLPS